MAHDVIHTSAGDTLPPFDPVSFWTRFRHGTASVAGVRLHFVEGGEGAPILLLPGWPQSWYVWRYVAPPLAAWPAPAQMGNSQMSKSLRVLAACAALAGLAACAAPPPPIPVVTAPPAKPPDAKTQLENHM